MVRHRLGQPKLKEREKAINLRKRGCTYSEILKQVPVAKSTLSVWLGEVGLTQKQKQRISEKRRAAMARGSAARRRQRIENTIDIIESAQKEVRKLSKRELWLVGIALYWAEGTKAKPWRTSVPVEFSNSDPRMVRLYMTWLRRCCKVSKSNITVSIYIHESAKPNIEAVKKYWSKWTGMPVSAFEYVYYKKHNPKTSRGNIGQSYNGNVRIQVLKSTDLNRRIEGWTKGVYSGVV